VDRFRLLDRALDTGDLVVVTAVPGRSRSGTPSLLVRDLALAAKALHPVPYPRRGDSVRRLPQRSSDLMARPGAMGPLRLRSHMVAVLRRVLEQEGYREVETPILNTVHGGATARPFRTYSNAYGLDLTLRIAPELQLKRLLVAGSGPIFEIGRTFRNEGADATHNPEFTSLEVYRPFADYKDMKELAERLIKAAAAGIHGAPRLLLHGQSAPVDVSAPWPMVPVADAVSAAVGQAVSVHTDIAELLRLARVHGVPAGPAMGPGAVLEALYGKLVEPATVRPTFYCDFPVETSPLTAPHRSRPGLVERWDLVINGMELGTGYSELTDPQEQRRRLMEQSLKAAAGDVEAMEVDEDFLYAVETGMPPSGGLGLGVDRLAMLLAGTDIRDVLSFPFGRPASTS
jgi:lysyl-tRNA synthetase class 2